MTENVNEQLVYEAAKRSDISLCLELLELLDRFLSCDDRHTCDRIVLTEGEFLIMGHLAYSPDGLDLALNGVDLDASETCVG